MPTVSGGCYAHSLQLNSLLLTYNVSSIRARWHSLCVWILSFSVITSTRLLATILSLSRICTVSAINILGKRYLVHISQKSRVGLGHAYIDYRDPYTQYNFFMFSVSICLCLHSFDMCCRILLSHMHRLESILRLSQVLLNLIAASFRNYFTFFFQLTESTLRMSYQ